MKLAKILNKTGNRLSNWFEIDTQSVFGSDFRKRVSKNYENIQFDVRFDIIAKFQFT